MAGFIRGPKGELLYDTGQGVIVIPPGMMPWRETAADPNRALGDVSAVDAAAFIRRRHDARIAELQAAEGEFLARHEAPFVGPPTPQPVAATPGPRGPRRMAEPPARREPSEVERGAVEWNSAGYPTAWEYPRK